MFKYLDNKKYILFLILILLLGTFLRLYGIKWGLPDEKHFFSYSPDEYTIFQLLSRLNPSKFDFNIHTYFNGSIFVYILAFVFKTLSLMKIIILTTSREFYHFYPLEWGKLYLVGRLTMVSFSILTVYLVYLIGKNLYNKKVGLISCLLFSTLPLHVVLSHQMIIDVFVIFWVCLAFVFLSKILFSNAWRWYVLAGIAIGASIVAKITAVTLLPFIFLCHLIREKRLIINKKLIVSHLVIFFSFLFFNPYLPFNLSEVKNQLLEFNAHITTFWIGWGYNWLGQIFNLSQYGLGVPLFILTLAGIFLGLILRKKSDIIILSWIIINFIIISKTFTPFIKYHLIISPFMVMLGSRFIYFLLEKTKIIRYSAIVIIISIVFFTLILSLSYDRLMASRDVRDEASDWIISNIPKGSKIGVAREPYYFSPPVILSQYFYTGKSQYIKFTHQYEITNLGYDLNRLNLVKPDYLVISDSEYYHILRIKERFCPSRDSLFIQEIFNKERFIQVKRFQKEPKILGIKFSKGYPPRDWLFIYPTIHILKRI